jgi:pilus assembly protein CpaE
MAAGRILIVDPDAASRNYVTAALQREGYEVLRAASAQQGLVVIWRDQPDLILADPVTSDIVGEQFAARLRSDPRTANVPLVGLSSDRLPARRESCLAAGFSAFLVKSPDVMSGLVQTLAELLGSAAVVSRDGGLQIAFLSAKGGTGTSSLCANIAMNMAEARPGAGVVVADLVLPIGSLAGIVGYEGGRDVVNLTEIPAGDTTPDFLRAELPRMDAWGFHIVAGSPDPERGIELDVGRIGDVVTALQQSFDLVLVDLGRSLSRISMPLIQRADLVVMIVATDLSTVTLSKTVWDYLRGKGVQARAMYLMLNRAVGLEGVTKADAEKIIGLDINATVPYLAENFSLANNQHTPYAVKFPGDTASIILRDNARQIMDRAQRMRSG